MPKVDESPQVQAKENCRIAFPSMQSCGLDTSALAQDINDNLDALLSLRKEAIVTARQHTEGLSAGDHAPDPSNLGDARRIYNFDTRERGSFEMLKGIYSQASHFLKAGERNFADTQAAGVAELRKAVDRVISVNTSIREETTIAGQTLERAKSETRGPLVPDPDLIERIHRGGLGSIRQRMQEQRDAEIKASKKGSDTE